MDLGLDIVDGVRGLNLEGDGFTREATIAELVEYSSIQERVDIRFNENLHLEDASVCPTN